MKITYLIYGFFITVLFSCASVKSRASLEDIQALKNIIEAKNFLIESDTAYPRVTNAVQQVLNSVMLQTGSNASSVNLIGNANFLKISKDSVSSYLPYFGERQMAVSLNSDSAIQLYGLMEDYRVEKNKNESYIIKFNARSKSAEESFNVLISIFPNLKCDIVLNGMTRLGIRYSGNLKELPIE